MVKLQFCGPDSVTFCVLAAGIFPDIFDIQLKSKMKILLNLISCYYIPVVLIHQWMYGMPKFLNLCCVLNCLICSLSSSYERMCVLGKYFH